MTEEWIDRLDDRDLGRVVAWLDGELGTEEQLEFELEMLERPELAAAVEQFESTESFLSSSAMLDTRAPLGGDRPQASAMPIGVRWGAAAVVLLAFGAALWRGVPRSGEFKDVRVAVLAAKGTDADFFSGHPGLADLEQSVGASRGGGGESVLGLRELDELRQRLESTWRLSAEASFGSDRVAAGGTISPFFRVPLDVPQPCDVAVIGAAGNGDVRILFPDDELEFRRLDAGFHILPAPPLMLSGSAGESVELSFVEPFRVLRSEATLTVRVLVRPAQPEGKPPGNARFVRETRGDSLVEAGFRVVAEFVVDPR